VEDFAESPEVEKLVNAHPDREEFLGDWIDNLLYFGYAYQSVTLPHMTRSDVEAIVTRLFPDKISLLDPDDADTAIPELTAFWQFLRRAYKHPAATQVLKFLKDIEPKFKQIMNDPNNFGIAKSFLIAGSAAGFDMTTEEGIQAFQQEYNQQLNQGEALPLPGLKVPLDRPATDDAKPGSSMPIVEDISWMLPLVARAAGLEDGSEQVERPKDFLRQLRVDMWRNASAELPPPSDTEIALLKQQTIIDTQPGTILRDFQILLEFIGESGIEVSGVNNLLPLKILAELNQRLGEPLQIDLKRPQQKSYPPINGLYLLLRTMGLGQINSQGKKPRLTINTELLNQWQQLNPTEQYMTLLEAWLIRADEELLGERRSPLNEGTKCIQFWRLLPDKGQRFKNYNEQQNLSYWPELHNLALLKLFGLMEVESGKPEVGKGWRIKAIKRLPFGNALMQVIVRAFMEQGMEWESETDESVSFGELKPALQSYFPEWQKVLALTTHQFQSGVFIFRVSLRNAWRRIAISAQLTLAELSQKILQAFEFDSDHLDMFVYRNAIGRQVEVHHPYADQPPHTNQVKIGDLPLSEGSSMTYIFDFGDWWEFAVVLESIQKEDKRTRYSAIIESHGTPPEQYPDWDEG
jgi:hypothetical protein